MQHLRLDWKTLRHPSDSPPGSKIESSSRKRSREERKKSFFSISLHSLLNDTWWLFNFRSHWSSNFPNVCLCHCHSKLNSITAYYFEVVGAPPRNSISLLRCLSRFKSFPRRSLRDFCLINPRRLLVSVRRSENLGENVNKKLKL